MGIARCSPPKYTKEQHKPQILVSSLTHLLENFSLDSQVQFKQIDIKTWCIIDINLGELGKLEAQPRLRQECLIPKS